MKTNYLAVVVCAVLYWLLGFVWFDLVFGKTWMALEHFTEEQAKNTNMTWLFIVSFLLNFLIAFVLAQICAWRNANTASRGAAVGVLLWIGILGPIAFTTYLYEGRPMALFCINEFYPLAGLCLMGAVLGAWKKKPA